MENNWVKHTEINYSDDDILQYHFDTRDFYGATLKEPHDIPYKEIKSPEYFYTGGEIKQIVEDLYIRSGGEKEYRYLAFKGNKCCGWECKYLRFYKTEFGFVCVMKKNRFKNKEFWNGEINKKILCKVKP